jgi:beta-mannosidase
VGRGVIFSLDDDGWTLREALGHTWQWYVDAPMPALGNNVADAAADAAAAPGWLPARVPGSVVGDLVRAGEVASPFVGRQSRAVEWTGARHWVYRRRLDLPALVPDERAVLELDGVDPGGVVFVDGVEVGRVDGLYHRLRADLTDVLRSPGPHRLAVVVSPVPESQPQVGRTEDVRLHAPRMNYGWDFSPRLPHQGIWRGARIHVGRLLVREATVAPRVDDDLRHATVQVDCVLEGAAHEGEELVVTLTDDQGTEVAEQVTRLRPDDPASSQQVAVRLSVDEPRLWWPRGHGGQPWYTVRLRAGSDPAPLWSATTGLRHVRMLANPDGPADALPYTAEVNRTRVPLIGWNWAPADALHGESAGQRVEHLLDLAADSGARLIRVWGGGLVESSAFYEACDRRGLLVWQEFSQSSSGVQSAPSTSPAFLQLMHEEALEVAPGLRRHPSLLMWGGGNELDVDGIPADEQSAPALAVLRRTLAEVDPGRHWVPTSPSGPAFHNRLDVIEADPEAQHDVHGPWEHQGLVEHYRLYNAGTSLAHTEFGVEGMTNPKALRDVVPVAERWPAGRSNPAYRHPSDWWNNEELLQACFGSRLDDLDTIARASQLLQATGLGYAVEADRRRAPRCSMVLVWQLNESFPNAWCTSAVDYYGEAKLAYHAVARAFADDRVTLQVDQAVWPDRPPRARVWTWSMSGVAPGSRVVLRLLDADGKPHAHWDRRDLPVVTDPAEQGEMVVDSPSVPPDSVLFWEASWIDAEGRLIDRTLELMTTGADWASLLDLPPSTLEAHVITGRQGAAEVQVKHVGGPAAIGLQVTEGRPLGPPGRLRSSGDPSALMPGETRRFGLRWDASDGPPVAVLQGWNVGPTVLDLAQEADR